VALISDKSRVVLIRVGVKFVNFKHVTSVRVCTCECDVQYIKVRL
jgi:hypothetical protein